MTPQPAPGFDPRGDIGRVAKSEAARIAVDHAAGRRERSRSPLPATLPVKPLFVFALVLASLAGCGKSSPDTAALAANSGRTAIRFAHVHAPDVAGELHFTAVAFA